MDRQAGSDRVKPGAGGARDLIKAFLTPSWQGHPGGDPEQGPAQGGNSMSPVGAELNYDVRKSPS